MGVTLNAEAALLLAALFLGQTLPWVNVTDTPVLGYYYSGRLQVIARHLGWLRDLGVDCLIISWWGPGHYTDQVARLIYERLGSYGLKAAIMIEPYLGSDNPSAYNALTVEPDPGLLGGELH